MKLKNLTIIALVNSGLTNTTEHDVPASESYKAYKFRRAVGKAFDAIAEKDKDLPTVAGVKDGGKPTREQEKKIAELRQALYDDETELDGNIVPMTWESWCLLSAENKKVPVRVPSGKMGANGEPEFVTQYSDVFRSCDSLLEGILWNAPEE